jgi:hypothetical protein
MYNKCQSGQNIGRKSFIILWKKKRRERCGGGEMESERKSGGRVGWF